jgi:phosphoesterase RecJ-like protein
VVPEASCTAEIIYTLAKELGVEITAPIADALYVALVTDTGRFMYENTTPSAHPMAAELIEMGVDVHSVYRRLYENLPFGRLRLLSRALDRVKRLNGGALTVATLTREDFNETGCTETDSEGIVDHLRAVEGTAVAVLVRELLSEEREGMHKVSLRATNHRVDVSAIARGMGGGGHRQAAGFSTGLPLPEVIERVRTEVSSQLAS